MLTQSVEDTLAITTSEGLGDTVAITTSEGLPSHVHYHAIYMDTSKIQHIATRLLATHFATLIPPYVKHADIRTSIRMSRYLSAHIRARGVVAHAHTNTHTRVKVVIAHIRTRGVVARIHTNTHTHIWRLPRPRIAHETRYNRSLCLNE